MAKLHEALAVIDGLKGQMEKTRGELIATFSGKRHLFGMKLVTFKSAQEGVPDVTEEQSDIQTTVLKELRWLTGLWAKSVDVGYQVAEANTTARADLIVDGHTLATSLPSTALLELSKRANELHQVLAAAPTLDPAKGFQPDADKGGGVYRAREERRDRTKKIIKPLILHPPTKEHPAQVQAVSEDIIVGHTLTQEWSGMITPAQKAAMLDRCEALKRGIKEALARANDHPVDSKKNIAAVLFNFVLTEEKGSE